MDRLDDRMGALALGASAIALGAFPLLSPFFPLDVFSTSILATAAGPVTSAAWVGSHLLATVGFVLLIRGLLALYGRLAGAGQEPVARTGLGFALAGIGLVLPALGVETFAVPVIGHAYLAGHTAVEAVVAPIYRGPMTAVMLVGLVLLAVGAIRLFVAVRRSGALPAWAAALFAVGLSAWCPIFPRPARVIDALLIGVSGVALAWSLWRAEATRDAARHAARAVTARGAIG
jgi:hypothetical protein